MEQGERAPGGAPVGFSGNPASLESGEPVCRQDEELAEELECQVLCPRHVEASVRGLASSHLLKYEIPTRICKPRDRNRVTCDP